MRVLLQRVLVLMSVLFFVSSALADTYLKREMRGVWMTTHKRLDWPSTTGVSSSVIAAQKAEAIAYLDRLKEANINMINFQVRPYGDAFYKSSYEPWSANITGTRGTDPGWDPLAFWIEECHKRGIELYAWINPFRLPTDAEATTSQDKAIKNKGWVLSYNNLNILNPGLSAVRTYICDVIGEIVTNYDLDGVIFDDYFYISNMPTTSSAPDYSLFKASGWNNMANWRRGNINTTLSMVYDKIKSIKDYCRFGVSPAGVSCSTWAEANANGVDRMEISSTGYQYNGIFSNPPAWIQGGYLDFISPQIYWSSNSTSAPYKTIDTWWAELVNDNNCQHFASMAVYAGDPDFGSDYQSDFGGFDELITEVKHARTSTLNAAPGVIHYRALTFKAGRTLDYVSTLKSRVYQKASLIPISTRAPGATSFGKVDNLEVSGSSLTWDAVADSRLSSGCSLRYIVYAIPESTTTTSAQSTISGGGIKSDYILGVSYTNSFTIPSAYQSGYYYAVTVYDRYGYEYTPRYSNEVTGPATKVTLTAPTNGKTVSYSTTFSWTAGTGEEPVYKFQISKNSSFSNIVYEQSELTATNYTINVNTLLDANTTYYWRVVTSETNKTDTNSDTYSFITADKEPAGAVTLKSPTNGTTLADADTYTFSWSAVSGCTYVLQVASDSAFGNIIYLNQTSNNTCTFEATALPYNTTLYWRVVSEKTGYKDSTSSVWSFTTPTRTYADRVTLVSPTSGATLTSNITFIFSREEVNTYTIQVSNSSTFSNILLESSFTQGSTILPDNWGLYDDTHYSYFAQISQFASGTYYWRVKTTRAGLVDSYSDTWSFSVSNSSGESGYTPVQEPTKYPIADDYYSLVNLWYRTGDFGNIHGNADITVNRSFCVLDNVIYISGRSANSSTATCYLHKYNAATGAFMGNLQLSNSVQCAFYPCNDVMKDNNGNLAVSNLTLNITSTPLKIYQINPSSGAATLRASLSSSLVGSGRIDHSAVYGDLSTGNFTVMAAVASSTNVLRWVFTNGTQTGHDLLTVPGLWPTYAASFGIAPRVAPLNADKFLVNGGATSMSKYTFANSNGQDNFDSVTDNNVYPYMPDDGNYGANGCCWFKFDDNYYVVYPSGTNLTGYTFKITKSDSEFSYKRMKFMWEVSQEEEGFGTVQSKNIDVLCDSELSSDGKSVNIYFYVPGNGLAAYSMYRTVPSGVESISGSVALRVEGNRVLFSEDVDAVEVYNMQGLQIACGMMTNTLTVNANKGIYVVKYCKDDKMYVKKIVM